MIYDIFGYSSQILQGADILATSDKQRSYKVFMPDFLGLDCAQMSWMTLPADERMKKMGALFGGPAEFNKTAKKVLQTMEELVSKHPEIKSWGFVGYCWGAKVESLVLSEKGHPFKAGAECHPAKLDPEDAKKIEIPVAILASKDEDMGDVDSFGKNLKAGTKIEKYEDQIHGWMGARADLEDGHVRDQYLKGYRSLLDWFHEKL